MSQVPHELQLALNSLSPQTAHLLEQTVLDAIRLANAAERAKSVVQEYPEGYFEKLAGVFENEEFEAPLDLPFESREKW